MEYKVNPDKDMVKLVKEGLKATGGYCPCELDRGSDNKCPCKVMREQGTCRCGLYV